MIKKQLLIFFIFCAVTVNAHYPTDLLRILLESELIVKGSVVESTENYFEISIDTIIFGEVENSIIRVKYKKDNLALGKKPKYKNYDVNQKVLLFLKYIEFGNDSIWVSTGTYAEAEMVLKNDTIHFSNYHSIEKCSFKDFIKSINTFNHYFSYSFNYHYTFNHSYAYTNSIYVANVKQIQKTDDVLIHCSYEFYTELIDVLKGKNCQTVFKKNKEWQYDSENGSFHPMNGVYNSCNGLIIGKYINGRRIGLWYILGAEYIYRRGEFYKERLYYETGVLKKETNFRNNKIKYYSPERLLLEKE